MNNRGISHTALETRKFHIKVQAGSVSSGELLLLLAVPSHDERDKQDPSDLFYKGTNPIHEDSMNHFLRPYLPMLAHWRLGFNIRIWGT
jgi:hypothetical protein